MKTIKTLLELETQLKADIDNSNKDVNIFAGHLPLRYLEHNGERKVIMDENWWGQFSLFTFRMGCSLVKYALDLGRGGKILLVVDDDDELLSYENDRNYLNDKNWHKKPRKRLRRKSLIPESYQKILDEFGLDTSILGKQQFKKYSTVLISERNLKKESREMGFDAPNECSLAYKSLLYNKNEHYFDSHKEHHICFIPDQCKTNLCDGIIKSDINVDASYVFFPKIEDMGGIVKVMIGHERLRSLKPLSVDEYFAKNLVSYIKTTHNNVYNTLPKIG